MSRTILLKSAPTLLTLRGVPPQLLSQSGVEAIAAGVTKLIPNSRASLPLTDLGTAKIRAIVPLGSPLPSAVVIQDSNEGSVQAGVEYGRLPAFCSACKSFGYSAHRCPSRHSKAAPKSPLEVPSSISLSPGKSPPNHPTTVAAIPSAVVPAVQDRVTCELPQNPSFSYGPQKPTSTQDLKVNPSFGQTSKFRPTKPISELGPSKPISEDIISLESQAADAITDSSPLPPSVSPPSPTVSAPPPTDSHPLSVEPSTTTSKQVSLTTNSLSLNVGKIQAESTVAIDTPHHPLCNKHIYFSIPNTPSSDSSPPVSFLQFYEEVLNTLPKPFSDDTMGNKRAT